jgi:phage shock protein PspC (stress-responsive transcriptional regulator)
MYRSFDDRVLGGVCGGLAALLPLSAWWFRVAFALLAPLTLGAAALLYVALWLAVPQASPARRRRGGAGLLLLAIVLAALTFGGWLVWIGGDLRGPTGIDLYWPGMLLGVALIFFVRQVRG